MNACTLSLGKANIYSGNSTMEFSVRLIVLILNNSEIEGSIVVILLQDRFNTSMERIVKTSFGIKDNYLLERSNYLALLLLAWRRKTVN
jgi:hypothetical protein